MTDKEKIREEVERLKSNLIYGACSSQIAMETMCKEEAYNEVLAILDTMQEEPVSEDLEEAAKNHAYSCHTSKATGERIAACIYDFKAGAKWQKKRDYIPLSDDINEVARQICNKVLNCEIDYKEDDIVLSDEEECVKAGIRWQKKQDQSTIELAEDHAMLAGMEKMKEQMMKEPNLSGYVARDEDGNLHVFEVEPRRLEEKHRWWDRDYHCHIIDNDAFSDLRWEDEPICVKLIIIKED